MHNSRNPTIKPKLYFSDFFLVSALDLDNYGAFNISLINDLPLFIDPFLLFNSEKREYQKLHQQILQYMRFLRDRSRNLNLDRGLIRSWYVFPEVKQTWLGFSLVGNKGQGLRDDFAYALHANLHTIMSDFGGEGVTQSSHLEKLCLIKDGTGRDRISDFTTNLIKDYLCQYTHEFASLYIRPEFLKRVAVRKARFNYQTQSWQDSWYLLPWFNNDYVILTPKDLLTRDDNWINRQDLYDSFQEIPSAIPNEQLRAQINNYFRMALPKKDGEKTSNKERNIAIDSVIKAFPIVLDYYIRRKEDTGYEATNISEEKVALAETQYIDLIGKLVELLREQSDFYSFDPDEITYQESLRRIYFLKDVIENKDGYRYLYVNGKAIERESDIQIMYRLTWYATSLDVNREVNNGRGPVDFKVSRGSTDSTVIEFKLAKNRKLRRNLQNQVGIYRRASDAQHSIVVIVFFSESERLKVRGLLDEVGLTEHPDVILIDARSDNKPSGSTA
jgi:hypothetical protein